ncbi:MAG: hypothetical protein JNK48_05640 [Bryobacterales bacterium]|nr:hypothetical protein [Bryobacterales bacterium]
MNRAILIVAGVLIFLLLVAAGWSVRQANLNEKARVAAELRMVAMRDFLALNLPGLKQSVEYLPGSGKARMALLDASRLYLAELVKEGVGDARSRLQLAAVYQQTADLEASLAASDLDNYKKSAENYGKAIELRQQVKDTREAAREALIDLYTRRAMILQLFGKFDDAKKALEPAFGLFQDEGASRSMKQKAARMFSTRAYIALHETGAPGAEGALRKALMLLGEDNEPQSRYEIARATRLLAMLLAFEKRSGEARDHGSRSVSTGERLLAEFPARDDYRRGLAASYVVQAGLLPAVEARPMFAKALEACSFVVAADPYDVQAGSELIAIATRMAAADDAAAVEALTRARELIAPLLKNFPNSYTAATDQINLALQTARYLKGKGRQRDALDTLKRVLPLASEQAAEFPKLDFVRGRLEAVQQEMSELTGAVARGAN